MADSAATLRVLTLNCWNINEPFAERMALVRAEIEALQPDVIGLQEIVTRRDGFDQGALILGDLGFHRAFAAAFRWNDAGHVDDADADGDAFGNLIASRWPILRHERRVLPSLDSGERRCAVAAVVDAPFGPLPFVCTHLNWRPDQGVVREWQAFTIAELARSTAEGAAFPPVIVGDFNAEPDSTEIRFLCGLSSLEGRSVYFQDAWRLAGSGPGYTWDNRNRFAAMMFEPNRRIDYILVGESDLRGRGWIERVHLALDEPRGEVFASDHFGLVADVRI